ncbi:MAG: carbohydrate ABC transporter permease [Candidatus Latescibacterota bacterium]|nr:MAG: carbohydrate ABC transporter permease [Candidatus Latescibacterota bacterium]
MIAISLQSPDRVFETPGRVDYVPWPPDVHSYARVLGTTSFLLALRNSCIVAGGTLTLALALGSMAAYALARLGVRGRRVMLALLLAMSMFPQIAILGGLFAWLRTLGLFDTHAGLILSYQTVVLPFTVWVMHTFFKLLPPDLEDAAALDGAGPLRTFWSVVLPLAAPGLVSTGLLGFIAAWNEFLFALTFTTGETTRTVPVAIALFRGASPHEIPWTEILAASVVVSVPLLGLVLFFQRRLVEGLTAGAIKG